MISQLPAAVILAGAVPAFAPHLEVWLLSAAVVVGGVYVVKVIGPKVVPAGQSVVTRRQIGFFAAAVALMTLMAIWPMHDIAEQRLYSAHMFQHLVLTLMVPPLYWLSCPGWLADLVVGTDGWAWKVVRRVGRPVMAWGIFNAFNLFSHWAPFVNAAVTNGPFHFGAHVLFVLTALIMWIPVCGPWPQLRLSLPGQMVYLFLQSVVPTLPAAWLANSESVIYSSYDQPIRLWGISALDDQIAAGIVMKLLEVAYLWGIIIALFFKWAGRHLETDRQGRTLTEREILEWQGAAGGLSASPVADPVKPSE
jgi:putative membrane protein